MSLIRIFAAPLALSCLVFTPPAQAQNAAGPAGEAQAKAGEVAPVVPELADRLLKEVGGYIGSAEQFTFHADVTFDHVLPSEQKLQFSAAEDIALQRPHGIYVEWSGDLGNRRFWYDGAAVTLYDPSTPFYASESAPADIDGMLDMVISQLNFSPPLADLLYSDPYGKVRGNIQFGVDLGLTDVSGRRCRTLAFVEKNVDWQIWIKPGPQPTPCKITISYKDLPSRPEFSAVFSDWDFAPRFAAPLFTPLFPKGTEKVPFDAVSSAK
jgi:hypothetical protein